MNPELNSQIAEIARECVAPGWDGYGADAVTAEAVSAAIAFAGTIPDEMSMPSVGVEPDGVLTFEWYRGTSRVLSVSVAGGGQLHYAAIIEEKRFCGEESFRDRIPPAIAALVSKVDSYGEAAIKGGLPSTQGGQECPRSVATALIARPTLEQQTGSNPPRRSGDVIS